MSKSFRNAGILLAGVCGVLTTYATLRPALEEQKAERLGHEISNEKAYGTVISDQMRGDFQEAGKELRNEGGFAWGIRKALFGRDPNVVVKKEEERRRKDADVDKKGADVKKVKDEKTGGKG